MTTRVMDPPQDVQQMCKQAERDQESKKLTLLLERVKRQIAARQDPDKSSKELGRGVSPAKPIDPARKVSCPVLNAKLDLPADYF